MSQAAETLDGWYNLHSFYAVDQVLLRVISRDKRDALVTEFQSLSENTATVRSSKSGDQTVYSITGQKANLLLWFLRPEMEPLDHIKNEFNKLRIADLLIPIYSRISVVELSNYLTDRSDEDPYENPHIKAGLYPELPHSDYICLYPMNKRRNETYNRYISIMEEHRKLMYDYGMIGRRYAGKVKRFITDSVGFDDFEWGVTLFSSNILQFRRIVYETRLNETAARYGEFGSLFARHIINTNKFGQLFTASWYVDTFIN